MSNILIGITGGIAAYKIPYLIRLCVKKGHNVKVIMTENAQHFLTRETLETLTQNRVYTSMWNEKTDIMHIELSKWADILVIAPATANIMGKCSNGIADDLLSTAYLSMTCPVLFCPAMNVHMYAHYAVQKNIDSLSAYNHILVPDEGFLACNDNGKGRLPEPARIMIEIEKILYSGNTLKGKTVIITGGSVSEPIDPVRVISNKSSGRMAVAMARAAYMNKADRVIFIYQTMNVSLPEYTENIHINNTDEIAEEIKKYTDTNTVLIMAAAVSDFKAEEYSIEKIKKNNLKSLHLTENIDVLESLKNIEMTKIGFALETENGEENAMQKMKRKKLDYIILNNADAIGSSKNTVIVFSELGKCEIEEMGKDEIALEVIKCMKL